MALSLPRIPFPAFVRGLLAAAFLALASGAAGAPAPLPSAAPAPVSPTALVPVGTGAPTPLSPSAGGLTGTAGARGVSGTAKPKGARRGPRGPGFARSFDQTKPISIQGHRVRFDQQDETLLAEGDVVLVSGDTQVHAQRLWYDVKQGLLRAEGNVVVADSSGDTLWAKRLAMNQVSRTGQARGILYTQSPWVATCGGADMLPGNVVVLHGCECTSCRQEVPMWRIWAKKMRFKAGDSITAWGVWLYTGRVPVFYIPYFSRSIKDPRPPIEIKPGYSSVLGNYEDLGYNYYLGNGQYGTVRYDQMSNYGSGFGWGQHYKVPGGSGTVAGYFNNQKNDPSVDNYSANWTHKQDLGHGLTLQGNLQLLSNPDFNEIFDMSQVDSFSQTSYVELSSHQKTYSWDLQAGYTNSIQSLPVVGSAQMVTQSVVTQETLPSFTYSHDSTAFFPDSLWAPARLLYWGVQASAQRQLVVPQVLDNLSGTATEAFDPNLDYYMDGVTISPTISDTFPIRHDLSLNTVETLNMGWVENEAVRSQGAAPQGTLSLVIPPAEPGVGSALAGFGTAEDLQWRARRGLTTDLTYQYQRQLDPQVGILWSGEAVNLLALKLQEEPVRHLSLLATGSYDLRPYSVPRQLERLSLINLQSSWTPPDGRSGSLSGSYSVPNAAFKTVDASYNASDPGRRWQTNLSADWVNNAIIQIQPPQDFTAPPELGPYIPRVMPDQLFVGIRNSLALGPKWKVSYYDQFDLVNRRLNQQAYTVDRDFDCIDLQIYARQDLFMGWQYGFSVSLSAAPSVKFDTNQLNSDLFNPAQYGY